MICLIRELVNLVAPRCVPGITTIIAQLLPGLDPKRSILKPVRITPAGL